MEEGSSGIESPVTRSFEQSRHKRSTNEAGKEETNEKSRERRIKRLWRLLGICHRGDGELKDSWDLGLSDRESDGQFQRWNWY